MYIISKSFVRLYYFLCLSAIFFGCDRTVNINDTSETLPPLVPQSVIVTFANDGTVYIDWLPNQEINLKGYNVYRSVNDTLHLKLRAFTSSSYFTDDSLSYDSTYYYRITSVNTQNQESAKSTWVSARPVNYYVPNTPLYLEINARNWNDTLSIFLKWRPNTEGDIAGYKIYRSENPQFNADTNSFVGFSPTYYFSDKKILQLYKTYYYRIKAADKGGLTSAPGPVVSDMLLGKADAVYPINNSTVDFFPGI